MRDRWAARSWLRQPSFFVRNGFRLRASVPKGLPIMRPGRRPPVPNRLFRRARDSHKAGLAHKLKAGRRPMHRVIPHPAILRLTPLLHAPVIRVRRTWGPVLLVPLILGMPRLFKARLVTWAIGLVSTVIFLSRSKSGCCAATPTSGASPQPSSSG
jgi:hypothetical protein